MRRKPSDSRDIEALYKTTRSLRPDSAERRSTATFTVSSGRCLTATWSTQEFWKRQPFAQPGQTATVAWRCHRSARARLTATASLSRPCGMERQSWRRIWTASKNDTDYGGLRSMAGVPIGERGVILVGRTEKKSFDRFNLRLVEVLAGYVALVLGRLGREEKLIEANEAAEKARRETEEAQRTQSAFLANMSHEIRTPLTSIIGFAEALGTEASRLELPEGSALPDHADLIEKGGSRLLETLEGVLNLSKLEAGQIGLSAEPVDLAGEVWQAAQKLRPEAEQKHIDLRVRVGEKPTWAQADEVCGLASGLGPGGRSCSGLREDRRGRLSWIRPTPIARLRCTFLPSTVLAGTHGSASSHRHEGRINSSTSIHRLHQSSDYVVRAAGAKHTASVASASNPSAPERATCPTRDRLETHNHPPGRPLRRS